MLHVVPAGIMSFPSGGYIVENSVWFDGSADYLSRTPSSAGSNRKCTWSFWVKRSKIGDAEQDILNCEVDTNTQRDGISFGDGSNADMLSVRFNDANDGHIKTNDLMRDLTAWQHWVVAIDTDQSTAADRVKIYKNGTQITSFETASYPSQNYNMQGFMQDDKQHIGTTVNVNGQYLNGYLAEFIGIDGTQLAADSFGEFNDNGIWMPIDPSGLTFGTNGFHLDFKVASGTGNGAGTDVSGQNNHFTDNSMTAAQQVTDTCTNDANNSIGNYCTWNPLKPMSGTFSNGNLTVQPSADKMAIGTVAFDYNDSDGYYMEIITGVGGLGYVGIMHIDQASVFSDTFTPGSEYRYQFYSTSNASQVNDGGGSETEYNTGSTFGAGDVVQIAVKGSDIWFGVNNTWVNNSSGSAGNPSTGANPVFTNMGANSTAPVVPYCQALGSSYTTSFTLNCGQTGFSYTPPTGFKALNTASLAEPSVTTPQSFFRTLLYTGNNVNGEGSGDEQEINMTDNTTGNSFSFQPDFVWVKNRAVSSSHQELFDVVRGSTTRIRSTSSDAENTNAQYIKSFDDNGFTVGDKNDVNKNSHSYVAWCWKAGGSGSANSDGNVTGGSTVSVASHNGFAIVKYGDCGGAAKTIGHGMGQAPDMIMVKAISGGSASSRNWRVYHKDLTSDYVLYLDTAEGQASEAASFGTIGTSTFGVDGGNGTSANGESHIAYCFARTQGLIGIGSYTGGGSDRPHVIIDDGGSGFKPAFILGKQYNANGQNWWIVDNARETFNSANGNMSFPNSMAAEANNSGNAVDFIANGFVPRSADTHLNAAGSTYVYLAFAESPFALNNRAK